MSESTLDASPRSPSGPLARREERTEPAPWTLRLFMRTHPGWTTAILAVLGSLALVLWARTRPSFDAYGWLVWGHQTLAGSLNTNAAPSWKPLTYVFTVPYALFGHYELWLWMLTSVAISLGGAVFAARLAYRLTGGGRSRRWAGFAAGAFAAVAVLAMQDWWHYMLSAQSDTLTVAFSLAAVDCHLSGRPRWAFALGALASLGRPEIWPLVALYSVWAWRTIPSMRLLIMLGLGAVLLLWFGIPALTSRSPFVAASNAFRSGRRLRSDQVGGTLRRFLDLEPWPLELAALASLCWAAVRRDWTVLTLGAATALWVIVEIAFALHGWPALGRYMFGAAGLMVVIAAVLVGRLARAPGWLGVAVAALVVASVVPAVISQARAERRDLYRERLRTAEINQLTVLVHRLGGPARLRACGEPLTRLEYQTLLAWTLQLNVASVGFKYGPAIRRGDPVVLYTPIPAGGWKITALHQRSPSCLSLPR